MQRKTNSAVLLYDYADGSSLLLDTISATGGLVSLYEELDEHSLRANISDQSYKSLTHPGVVASLLGLCLGAKEYYSRYSFLCKKVDYLDRLAESLYSSYADTENGLHCIKWRGVPADDPNELSTLFHSINARCFILAKKELLRSALKISWNRLVSQKYFGESTDHLQFSLIELDPAEREELSARISSEVLPYSESISEEIIVRIKAAILNLVHRSRLAALFPIPPLLIYSEDIKRNPLEITSSIFNEFRLPTKPKPAWPQKIQSSMNSLRPPSFSTEGNVQGFDHYPRDERISHLLDIYTGITNSFTPLRTDASIDKNSNNDSPMAKAIDSQLSAEGKIELIKKKLEFKRALAGTISQPIKAPFVLVTFPDEYLMTLLQLWGLVKLCDDRPETVVCINKLRTLETDYDLDFISAINSVYPACRVLYIDQVDPRLENTDPPTVRGYRSQQFIKLAIGLWLESCENYIVLDAKNLPIRRLSADLFVHGSMPLNNFEDISGYWESACSKSMLLIGTNDEREQIKNISRVVSPVTPYVMNCDLVRGLETELSKQGSKDFFGIFIEDAHPEVTEFMLYDLYRNLSLLRSGKGETVDCPRRWSTIWPNTKDPLSFIEALDKNPSIVFLGLHRLWLASKPSQSMSILPRMEKIFETCFSMNSEQALNAYAALEESACLFSHSGHDRYSESRLLLEMLQNILLGCN